MLKLVKLSLSSEICVHIEKERFLKS